MFKSKLFIIKLLLVGLALASCQEDEVATPSLTNTNTQWSIPVGQVLDGGPGKDGIPSLTEPEMITPSEASYLRDEEVVIGIAVNGTARAYPHKILDWHEIINDKIGEDLFAVTHCPLTITSLCWNREFNGQILTFGVSGLLYNSNLIPYDRETDSNWAQVLARSVNGQLIDGEPTNFPFVEMTWRAWKELYPNTTVVSTNTGHSRNYDRYPYGNYKATEQLFFPAENSNDKRLFPKEIVHGTVLSNEVKVFRKSSFTEDLSIVEVETDEGQLLVIGSQDRDLFTSFFSKTVAGEPLDLQLITGQLPMVLADNAGNKWDIFGNPASTNTNTSPLKRPQAFNGFWFTWPAFFENVTIYEQ